MIKNKPFKIRKSILAVFVVVFCLIIVVIYNFSYVKAQNNQEDKCVKTTLAFGKAFDQLREIEESYIKCGGSPIVDFYLPQQQDKFGIIGLEGEWARLDAFAIQLHNNPQLLAYIVIYGGITNKFGELKERPKPLVYYLTAKRGIDPKRIKIIEGGFREKFEFEFWTSQSEKMFPPLSPTIESEKVIFRGKMKPLPVDF